MTDFKQLHIQVKSSMVQTNSMTSNHIGVVVIIISSSIISIIIIIPNRCRVRKMWNSSSPQRTCTWCKLDLECLCSVWALFLPWTSGVHHQNSSLAQLWLGLGHMGWSKSVPIAKKTRFRPPQPAIWGRYCRQPGRVFHMGPVIQATRNGGRLAQMWMFTNQWIGLRENILV